MTALSCKQPARFLYDTSVIVNSKDGDRWGLNPPQYVEQLDANQEVVGSSPICRHLFELTITDVSYKKRAGCLQDKNTATYLIISSQQDPQLQM